MPQLTSAWVEKKDAELEAEERADFEFSPAKLEQLCLGADGFWAGALRAVKRARDRLQKHEESEGNALSSGSSTPASEETRA